MQVANPGREPKRDMRVATDASPTGVARRRTLVQRSLSLNSRDLGSRVLKGAGFQALSMALRVFVTIGSTAVLARLLSPTDYGRVAMASVVTELAALFANFGLANILIQRQRISRLDLDTVFWATAGLGVTLSAVVFGLSFIAGAWFSDPQVGELLRVMCLTFILNATTAVPTVVLTRLMRFRSDFWIQMSSLLVRAGVAIACALAGLGVWSLVVGSLAAPVFQSVLAMSLVRYWPRLRFRKHLILSTWRTSSGYFGGSLLYFTSMSIDLILIGRQLGATTLGHYQNARTLTDEIRARIAMPLQQVLFPAFASVQAEPERARAMVLRSGRILAAVVIPIGIGISATASELVPILYGSQWAMMVPLLVMFGVAASFRAATAISSPIIYAHDKVTKALRYHAVQTLLLVVAVVGAMPWGIEAVTGAILVTSLYALVPYRFALSLLGLGWRHVWLLLAPPFIASLAFWGALLMLDRVLASWSWTTVPTFLGKTIVATLVYLALMPMLGRVYIDDVRYLLDKIRGSRS